MAEHLGEAPSTATPHRDSKRDTKQRLLDAAELLFATHGFEGTSMRAITQAADTSLSAANYHFGSKQALIEAALVRRIEPLNRRRLEATWVGVPWSRATSTRSQPSSSKWPAPLTVQPHKPSSAARGDCPRRVMTATVRCP